MNTTDEYSYDIVLIQPPLFKSIKDAKEDMDESTRIEFDYWDTMERNSGKLLGDLPVEASYGILSIGSYLKSLGYKVKILDFHLIDFYKRKYESMCLKESDIVREIAKYPSKFYGLSVMTIANNWANFIANNLRKIYHDSYLFFGGYYPSNNDMEILKNNKNIDFIVRNEGEFIIRDILEEYNLGGMDLSKINGITYRKEEEIVRTPPSKIIENLDELPFLDYSLYEEKFQAFLIPRVYTCRGCNNSCVYCTADNSSQRKIRKRSAKIVVDEIENIISRYQKKFFVMGDLEFLLDAAHSKEVCEEIIKRNLNIKWWCQVYPPNIREDIVKLMKKAGNIQIALGIESTNTNALEEINKKMSTSITLDACRIIKKFGIQVQAYIMIGLPGDTIDSSINTVKFVGDLIRRGLIDVTHISTMAIYPGSELFKNHEKYNITILDTDPNKCFMNCDFLGSSIPSYETNHMSNLEIYSMWLFALSHCQKCFSENTDFRKNFSDIYEDLGFNNISILDAYRG